MNLLELLFSATALISPVSASGAPQSSSSGPVDVSSQVSVQTTGNVTFDLGSDQVFDLHGNGTLRVTEINGNVIRELVAQGNQVVFTVNGASRPYDEEAKDWLRGIVAALPAPPPPPPPPGGPAPTPPRPPGGPPPPPPPPPPPHTR